MKLIIMPTKSPFLNRDGWRWVVESSEILIETGWCKSREKAIEKGRKSKLKWVSYFEAAERQYERTEIIE